jgi:hypothetical protein
MNFQTPKKTQTDLNSVQFEHIEFEAKKNAREEQKNTATARKSL